MIARLASPLFVKLAGVIGLGLILALGIQSWRLSTIGDKLDDTRRELVVANAHIGLQNSMIAAWKSAAEAAQARAQAAVSEALRINAGQQPVIVRLEENARRPRDGQCVISDELRNAEGL